MKNKILRIATSAVYCLGLLIVLCGAVAFGQGSGNGIHGWFNGSIGVSSVYSLIFGDNTSSDVSLQKTAANVVSLQNGILAQPYAGGTITTNGTAVGAGVCQAQPALTVTGVTTTSVPSWSIPTALPATWQTGIDIMPVVTANTVTLSLCNGTAGSITPAAQVVNIRVTN